MQLETLMIEAGAVVPNNPHLPVLLYRQAIPPQEDLAARFEQQFAANGWSGLWRNGIFDFHHYHTLGHEALGIARGEASLILGGPGGVEVDVRAGDCLVLPAGTGHCRRQASGDFLVIGAYPPGQSADIRTGAPDEAARMAIRKCPLPGRDPIDRGGEALRKLWQAP